MPSKGRWTTLVGPHVHLTGAQLVRVRLRSQDRARWPSIGIAKGRAERLGPSCIVSWGVVIPLCSGFASAAAITRAVIARLYQLRWRLLGTPLLPDVAFDQREAVLAEPPVSPRSGAPATRAAVGFARPVGAVGAAAVACDLARGRRRRSPEVPRYLRLAEALSAQCGYDVSFG